MSKLMMAGKGLSAFLLLFVFQWSYAQPRTGIIQGTVKTSDGKPAPAVNVEIKATGKVVSTDDNGFYQLTGIKAGIYTLVITHTGKKPETKTVTVSAGETVTADISLNEDAKSLQDVTVVAGYNKFARKETNTPARMPLKNLENPQVYNVIPKELLQDQFIVSYNDVMKDVAGSSQALVNGSNTFFLRGFITSSYLRNGLQDYKNNSVEVANLERIEVLKGPSATLFGNTYTSYGGLLNRVTKKPFETFRGEVGYTVGGFGLGRFTADVNTPLNKEKGLYMRTNIAYDDEGSFQDAGFTKRWLIAPSFLFKVNDRLSISLDAEIYAQHSNDFSRLFPVASATLNNPKTLGIDWKRSYSSNDITESEPSVSVYGVVNYKLSDQWTSQTSLSHTNSTTEGIYGYNTISGDTAVNRNFYVGRVDNNNTELQQNFTGDFHIGSLRNRVVIGADFLSVTANQDQTGAFTFDQVKLYGNDPEYSKLNAPAINARAASLTFIRGMATQNVYSAYISDVLNVTDNLLVMASIRGDHFVNQGTHNYTLDTVTGKYNQTSPAPKFGLVYQLIKNKVSLFGNYMNGFANNAPFTQSDGSIANFKPSHANQWEGGVKFDLFNGLFNSTVSYYHIKVDDLIHVDPTRAGYEVQTGGQLSKGIEAEVIANPFKGFNLIAGYSHNTIYTINQSKLTDGFRQWNGPAETANLWLSYHFVNTALKGLGLGVGGNYNGKAYIYQYTNGTSFYLPHYTVLNAAISYDLPSLRFNLKMDNLTNEVYWGSYVSQQMPRRFSAGVAFKF